LGNDLVGPKESTVGMDLSGKSFLLKDHPVPQTGLVFGFAVYIQKQTPIIFQIFRPRDENTYLLLKQWRFIPTVTEGIERVGIQKAKLSPVYNHDYFSLCSFTSPN
jgi:hypothetical protein